MHLLKCSKVSQRLPEVESSISRPIGLLCTTPFEVHAPSTLEALTAQSDERTDPEDRRSYMISQLLYMILSARQRWLTVVLHFMG